MVDDQSFEAEARGKHSAAPEPEHGFRELGHYVPRDLLDVSFPVSVRGYDRRAVDAYIERVNRVIAEIKVRASPPAAVRHALDQAGEKVEGLLQAAREAAEEMTASAQREAEENSERAKAEAVKLLVNTSAEADRLRAEADELIANATAEADAAVAKAKVDANQILAGARTEAENLLRRAQAEADERFRRLQQELAVLHDEAETQMREIHADTQAVWKERRELLDSIRTIAGGLVDLANTASARIERREPARPKEEKPKPEAGNEAELPAVATDASAPALPAGASQESAADESRRQGERTASQPDT